jgi:hypothetical protein
VYDDWTFLTTHGLVLLALARRPDLRIREVGDLVGLTERAAQGIVNDLVDTGYVERIREGRRNKYLVRGDRPLRHPTTWDHRVADVLSGLVAGPRMAPSTADCAALVLACSDHRYQEPLRSLLAAEGLLALAEVIMWPGGASAVAGPDGRRILVTLQDVAARRNPARVLLVAHQDCRVPGAYIRHFRDPFTSGRAVAVRRRLAVQKARRRLGLEPEVWFLSQRGARRVHTGGLVDPRVPPVTRARRGAA